MDLAIGRGLLVAYADADADALFTWNWSIEAKIIWAAIQRFVGHFDLKSKWIANGDSVQSVWSTLLWLSPTVDNLVSKIENGCVGHF